MHQSSGILHWVFGGVSVELKFNVRDRKYSGIFKACSKQQTWEIFRGTAGVWFFYFTFPHIEGSEGLDDCLDFCGLLIKPKSDLWMFWSLPNTNSHERSKEGLKSPWKLASQMCSVNAGVSDSCSWQLPQLSGKCGSGFRVGLRSLLGRGGGSDCHCPGSCLLCLLQCAIRVTSQISKIFCMWF